MKLRESVSMIALALRDLAQSFRAHVEHEIGKQLPPTRAEADSARETHATLLQTDDEDLWLAEQEDEQRRLIEWTKKQMEMEAQDEAKEQAQQVQQAQNPSYNSSELESPRASHFSIPTELHEDEPEHKRKRSARTGRQREVVDEL